MKKYYSPGHFTDVYNVVDKGRTYEVSYLDFPYDLDSLSAFRTFEAQIRELLPRNASNFGMIARLKGGEISYMYEGEIIDTSVYMSPEDMGMNNDEWVQYLIDTTIDTIRELR